MHHEQEVRPHPWRQFLTKEGTRYNASKTENCERDGYPNVEGWLGKKNRQVYYIFIIWNIQKIILIDKDVVCNYLLGSCPYYVVSWITALQLC